MLLAFPKCVLPQQTYELVCVCVLCALVCAATRPHVLPSWHAELYGCFADGGRAGIKLSSSDSLFSGSAMDKWRCDILFDSVEHTPSQSEWRNG